MSGQTKALIVYVFCVLLVLWMALGTLWHPGV